MTRLSYGPALAMRGFVDRGMGRKRRYFIAHSYKDEEQLSSLRGGLPAWMDPIVFPPIIVSPEEAVTDSLVSAITGCDGLIYLTGEASRASFWPNFERRFAQRLYKPVFAYDAARHALVRDRASAEVAVAPLWNSAIPRDHSIASEICRWLGAQRQVGTEEYVKWSETIRYGESRDSLRTKVSFGAPVVLFVSNQSCREPWPFDDADSFATAHDGQEVPAEAVAWLETPDPAAIEESFAALGDLPTNRGFRTAVMRSAVSAHKLVLAEGRAINRNRVDDLLVRIEHLAFKKGTRAPPTPLELVLEEARKYERQRILRM
jgi:hypothetical protein